MHAESLLGVQERYESLLSTVAEEVHRQEDEIEALKDALHHVSLSNHGLSSAPPHRIPRVNSQGLPIEGYAPQSNSSTCNKDERKVIEQVIMDTMREYIRDMDVKLGNCMADRVRRVTREHVSRSVEKAIREEFERRQQFRLMHDHPAPLAQAASAFVHSDAPSSQYLKRTVGSCPRSLDNSPPRQENSIRPVDATAHCPAPLNLSPRRHLFATKRAQRASGIPSTDARQPINQVSSSIEKSSKTVMAPPTTSDYGTSLNVHTRQCASRTLSTASTATLPFLCNSHRGVHSLSMASTVSFQPLVGATEDHAATTSNSSVAVRPQPEAPCAVPPSSWHSHEPHGWHSSHYMESSARRESPLGVSPSDTSSRDETRTSGVMQNSVSGPHVSHIHKPTGSAFVAHRGCSLDEGDVAMRYLYEFFSQGSLTGVSTSFSGDEMSSVRTSSILLSHQGYTSQEDVSTASLALSLGSDEEASQDVEVLIRCFREAVMYV